MDIYISNLSPFIQNEDIQKMFSKYGTVSAANIIMDKFTNRSKGFGFVTMPNEDEAQKAIQELDGTSIEGKSITVNKAKPREDRFDRSSSRNRW